MGAIIEIMELHNLEPSALEQLSDLLVRIVEGGASIGFLSPLEFGEAATYWKQVIGRGVKLWIATRDDQVLGTVQLHLAGKKNASHRAEVAKLMVHPDHRRSGVARLLMKTLEEAAREEGRFLLVLDTREGDSSNDLYKSLGYIEAGRIPEFAQSAGGTLDTTVLYYKKLKYGKN
ncbi:GNAT family N-acetyltransferase [Paenibacillus sp. YPG26]|uniref:GNAT family N-acetyltransferase n=1 Tax=Paenibacillus sp. YPG26 TaxID=2878915 RepID=UPI00203CCF81|nr:GNAT family N-acetyltransferase [Paenibacillus sp. YPG26]USB33413.1 GNAT family N-acetyltransferase [Paenibacillus sp. YPG26]